MMLFQQVPKKLGDGLSESVKLGAGLKSRYSSVLIRYNHYVEILYWSEIFNFYFEHKRAVLYCTKDKKTR